MAPTSLYLNCARKFMTALSVLAILACIGPHTNAASFAKDSEVRLKEDAPLLFEGREVRQGKAGEVFTVLQDNAATNRVFVLGKDATGKPIALSLPEDKVETVPFDIQRLAAEVEQLSGRGDIVGALAVVNRSMATGNSDPRLTALRDALTQLQTARSNQAAAKNIAASTVAKIQKLQRNAAIARTPNRLNPSDNSGAMRAAAMEQQAQELASSVEKSTRECDAALAVANEGLSSALAACRGIPSAVANSGVTEGGQNAQESAFVSIVQKYASQYKETKNELVKSSLRTQRKTELLKVLPGPRVTGWSGTLVRMETTSAGNAYVEVRLPGAKIGVKTWNNAISDTVDGTLIPQTSPIYAKLSTLSPPVRITFSGQFFGSDRDGIKELSATERGGMTEPEFLMKFTSLDPAQ